MKNKKNNYKFLVVFINDIKLEFYFIFVDIVENDD